MPYYVEESNQVGAQFEINKTDDNKLEIGSPLSEVPTFTLQGIAKRFVRSNMTAFASTYGLLGLNGTPINEDYMKDFRYREGSTAESIEEWEWHRNHIKKLIKLYHALKEGLPIKGVHLKKKDGRFYWKEDDQPIIAKNYLIPEQEDEDVKDVEYSHMAWLVLRYHILHFIEDNMFISFNRNNDEYDAPHHWGYADRKATKYLLCAIYYDLFQMINHDKPIRLCKSCGLPLSGKANQETCGSVEGVKSSKCRMAFKREQERKENKK